MASPLAIVLLFLLAAPTDMNLEHFRTRLIASVIPSDPAVRAKLTADAAKHAASLRADGTWADIDYADNERSFWKTQGHAQRVLTMSKAFRISADVGTRDDALLTKTLAALDHWLAKDFRNPNWWHNDIGTPQLIGESAVLIGNENLSSTQRERIDAIMARSNWATWTGQNLVWGVTNQVLRGLIKNDAEMITQAFARLYDEIVITTGEGIQRDFSFHQHGPQFYSGGYGLAFSMDVARYTAVAWGSPWQIPREKLDVFNGFMLDGQRWMMHYGRFDHSAVGREIARKGTPAVARDWTGGPITPRGAAYALQNAVRLLAEQPVPRQAEYREWLRSLAGDENTPPLIGNRHYWRSDYMVHHRPGWMASVRMFSDRLINTEVVNDEGKKSHHLADGANFLYLSGDDYGDIFPAWDWTKVPGTTAEQNTLDFEDGDEIEVKGKTSFVGGVSDGTYGLAAMFLARGDLRARKSWFFFESGYVCLGGGISCETDRPVATSVNQSRLAGEVRRGDNWVHHDNVGYVFGHPSQLKLTTEFQGGDWSDIGTNTGRVDVKVFNLWLDHGVQPNDAGYAYVVYPRATADDTARRAAAEEIQTLARTSDQHAVLHKPSGTRAIAFFQSGHLETPGFRISVNRPCLVLVRGDSVAVAKPPPHHTPTVTVRVNDREMEVEMPDGEMAGSTVVRRP